jgi:hypothetical protein
MAKIEPLRRPPSRSPERQALADAIQSDLDREAEIKRVNQALDKATALRHAAGDVVDAVEEAIEKRKDPKRLAERLLAGGEDTDDTAPEEVQLAKANADFDRASQAMEIIRSQLNTLESHRNFSKVKDAARAVARAELRHRLVEEIFAVRERYSELYALLSLVDSGTIGLDESWRQPPEWNADRNPSPKVAALRQWIEALASDPEAPCPR